MGKIRKPGSELNVRNLWPMKAACASEVDISYTTREVPFSKWHTCFLRDI